MQPVRVLFLAFTTAAIVGTLLLLLPVAKVGAGGASFIEALFSAISALCVTGLIIVDTATYWTPFGQFVLLALIQVGGLGVMTFASVVGIAIVRKLSFRSRILAASESKNLDFEDMRGIILGILSIALAVEGIIAALLTATFTLRYNFGFGEGLWLGVFHSVSAFNNAGFSLFTDSLMSYSTDALIGLPISIAIIVGGIGFPVIRQILRYGGRPLKWSMNTRLVLLGTSVLLFIGFAFVTATEWDNPATLGPLAWYEKLLAGFVQSVQVRTAGFNNLDISQMNTQTWFGMDILMFIGGGPAGTAGGIKVTTFAVVMFIVWAEIRGEAVVNVMGKRLARSVHRQAIAVVAVSMALVVFSTLSLLLITSFTLDQLLFEVISAFATVGLSTGITAALPSAGQLILIFLMFVGRLGPMTFASALALKERHQLYSLPRERPIIG